jgi:hypothetical protein
MGFVTGSAEYAAAREIYDRIIETVKNEYIKPSVSLVVRDNNVFGLQDELGDSKYAVLCFCTVGAGISGAVSAKKEEDKELEAALLNAVGDEFLKSTRKISMGYVKGVLSKQFLDISTDIRVPGEDLMAVFNDVVVRETEAYKLFEATVDAETNHINPPKSIAYVCGCDTAKQLPFNSFTPPDCAFCLRKDCELCI